MRRSVFRVFPRARLVFVFAFALVFFAYGATKNAFAENISYFLPQNVAYDDAVPTPEEAFGYGLGDKPVRHDQMVAYLRDLAERSDRISVETIGYSHEGRPILFFVVAAPDNHARLDDIRAQHLRRTDPSATAPDDADAPVVVWLNYGVHGAESSGMDAVIPVLYHFAAAQGAEIERTLDETVILVTAIFNPDGHSRRVNHVYTYLSQVPVTTPEHIQHDMWIEARTNHYWFDLNRQWLLLTQPEAQAWVGKWHQWKPNLSVDYHEMGSNRSTYYFHPGEPKRKNELIPERARDLLQTVAGYHADWLDDESYLYTTEEGFDNFYIGKGSTYPAVNGGLGLLFEAAAARGGRIDTDNGLRTYAQNIRMHFNTSLTSVEAMRANRRDMLAYQRSFFEQAVRDGSGGYVFALEDDRARLNKFLKLLEQHDVRVYELASDVTADGRRYRAGEAYVVPLAQPQHRMVRGLFERFTDFEENIFYDVSGWTLPLAFDIDYARLSRVPRGDAASPFESLARSAPPRSDYGYIFEWSEYYAPRALYRLLDAGIIARAATEPGRVVAADGVVNYGRGAVFTPLAGQTASAERIYDLVTTIAREDGIEVRAVRSGLTPSAGSDLGARDAFRVVTKPNVLLLVRDGLSAYDAGEVWHLLDYRMHMPVAMRYKDDLGGITWPDYTHIIIVGGSAALEDDTAERVEQWMREDGGVVIGLRQGAEWAQNAFLDEDHGEEDAGGEEDGSDDAPDRFDYDQLGLRNAEHVIGGAIFESDLDVTHPLGFGVSNRSIASLRNTSIKLHAPDSPISTVARYTDDPLLSGYASQKRLDELKSSPMMVHERVGSGAVVLFADNPNFRGVFYGTNKLFMNAVFFSTIVNRAVDPDAFDADAHQHGE